MHIPNRLILFPYQNTQNIAEVNPLYRPYELTQQVNTQCTAVISNYISKRFLPKIPVVPSDLMMFMSAIKEMIPKS